MKYRKLIILAVAILFIACAENTSENKSKELENPLTQDKKEKPTSGNQEFWDQLVALCGQSFEGEITTGPANNDFEGKKLVMHVLSCEKDELLIPFNVGENRSRTWILKLEDDLITLKHDHRKENGEADEITMYGGTTSNTGLPNIAVFPADQKTSDLIPYASTNVWWMTISDTSFTYNLKRIGGEGHFTVSFDLTKPVENPSASWGWEDFKSNKRLDWQ